MAEAAPEASRVLRRRARQLIELDDLQANARFGELPASRREAERQGRELAELTRQGLDLGSDALGDLATVMEQHFAIGVALSPMGTDVDGLCVHCGGSALVLASSDFSDGHLRFTLAHELGHHLLGDPRVIIEEAEGDMFKDHVAERRVNAFAAELLMPERGIRSVLEWLGEASGSVSERAVVALMEHFGVSMAALVHQLIEIGALSREGGRRMRERNSVHAMLSRHRDVAPSGAATGVHQVRRAPGRLTRHALEAVRSQKLGLSVVAALLGSRTTKFFGIASWMSRDTMTAGSTTSSYEHPSESSDKRRTPRLVRRVVQRA